MLVKVGWEAMVEFVGYRKCNKDHGITAPRNNVHVLKRHCQNATEAGPAACLHLDCYCSTVSARPVCCGTEGSQQTLFIMAQKPPKGPWGLVGKEFKSHTW